MRTRDYLALLALLASVVVVYAPGLSGGFVFDDFVNIVDNDKTIMTGLAPADWFAAAFSGGAGPLARPLSMLSFSLERYFFGLNPFPMKLTNLGIHLVNTLLVFMLLKCVLLIHEKRSAEPFNLVSPVTLALLVTAAWSLAPINLTGVLFIVQRMESLSTLFMLAGLLSYATGRNLIEAGHEASGWRWVLGGLLGFGLLAVLSKESGVMLPLYAALLEWLVFGGGQAGSLTRRRLVRLYLLVLFLPGLLGLAWLLPGILSGTAFQNRTFSLSDRLWTEARVVWDYLGWILAPRLDELSLYHDAYPVSRGALSPVSGLLGALGLGALLVVATTLRRRMPLLALGVFWFLAMHLLVSTVMPLELVFEHRNYMASVGVFLALFALIFMGTAGRDELRTLRFALAFGVIGIYAAMTFLRASEWGDPVRLANFESSRHPESPRAGYELGLLLSKLYPEPQSPGFSMAVRSFEHSAALPDTSLLPLQALIYLHGKNSLPIPDLWWKDAIRHVETRPPSAQDVNALYSLINAQTTGVIQIDKERLTAVLAAAYHAHPQSTDIITLYANALLNVAGRHADAEPFLLEAVVKAPQQADMWANLVRYQIATGQINAAKAGLSRLHELNRFGRLDALIAELTAMMGTTLPPKDGDK